MRAMVTGAVLAPVVVTSQPGQSSMATILKVLRKTGGCQAVVPGMTSGGSRGVWPPAAGLRTASDAGRREQRAAAAARSMSRGRIFAVRTAPVVVVEVMVMSAGV